MHISLFCRIKSNLAVGYSLVLPAAIVLAGCGVVPASFGSVAGDGLGSAGELVAIAPAADVPDVIDQPDLPPISIVDDLIEDIVDDGPTVRHDDGDPGSTSDGGSDAEPAPQYAIDFDNSRLISDPDADLKVVLLTIDDGPRVSITQDMLAVLDEYSVPAMFFVNGVHFAENAAAIRQMHVDGHVVGNHAWSHVKLSELDEDDLRSEIERTSDGIEQITGVRPTFFRAPFGAYTPPALEVAEELGMRALGWSIDPRDWSYHDPDDVDQIVANVVEHLHPGAVILIHQQSVTLQALPQLIEAVRAEGYEFVLPSVPIADEEELPSDPETVPAGAALVVPE